MLHRTWLPTVTLAIAAPMGANGGSLMAQEANPAHVHVLHVTEAFGATPDGSGLLPMAIAEATIAAEHARLAGEGDPTDIDPMIRHARHVLNAIDPGEFPTGPGLDFGVRPAAEGIIRHIELAANSEGASQSVVTHSAHVAAASSDLVQRADEVVGLARQVLAAGVYNEAYPLAQQLGDLGTELLTGADISGDGSISMGDGEAGLEQVERHMALLVEAEGL